MRGRNKDESGSLQSDEVEFSSCKGEDETGTDPKDLETGQLDSPLDPDVESIDIDPSTCDGRTVTRTASESDGLAVDETGGQAIAPGARCTGVARFSMTVFHLAVVAVLSFTLGFIFKAYI